MGKRIGVVLVGLGALVAPVVFTPGIGAQAAAPSVTVLKTTLHFKVVIGPDNNEVCDIIGDLYRPSNATAANPDPAILTTNGFGGSKNDQAYLGEVGAAHGYVVLSYSGLGFGGSGCQITLDDPDYDGKAASQLISFLGGAPGIGFYDAAHTQPFPPITYVVHDPVAHNGVAYRYDPRVGMVGGSYGGEIQFAAADEDPRLDTIVPIITWNDLSYSLTPNNADELYGVTSATPGVVKIDWPLLFTADGILDGLEDASVDPSRLDGCPNFALSVCDILAEGIALGYPTEDALSFFRHASVESYISHITIPTLLLQGENDTLFYLNEAAATYEALKAQGTPVKMIWQSWGHSSLSPAPGEFNQDGTVLSSYEGQRIFAWFDHYLKGDTSVSTGPAFSYFRDWIPDVTSGSDAVQYATSPSYPVGSPLKLYLSGTNRLVLFPDQVQQGQALVVNASAVPTSYSETSGVSAFVGAIPQPNPFDLPLTAATYETGVLPENVDVVGIPTLSVNISSLVASTTQFVDPDGMVEFFAKLYDVAPDGTMSLIHNLVSAVRAGDIDQPVEIQLPGIVHRFARGHRLALTISATDAAYHNSNLPIPFTVDTAPGSPSVLTLPVGP